MLVGTWHQVANAVDDNSVGALSAGGIAVNNVETVLAGTDFDTVMLAGGVQTVSDISAVEIIVVGSEADADTISEKTTWRHRRRRGCSHRRFRHNEVYL
jgi:hypothetical protein